MTVGALPPAPTRASLPHHRGRRPVLVGLGVALWIAAWSAPMLLNGGQAWHFFVQAAHLVEAPGSPGGGLHLYAKHPILQFGPLSVGVAIVLTAVLPGLALAAADLLGVLAGAGMVALVRRVAPTRGRVLLLAAVVAAPSWLYVSLASTHIDDVGALAFGVLAWWAAVRDRPVVAGLALGLAVDCKPWALGFAALLLVLPGWRRLLLAAAVAGVAVALAWAPFLLGDPGTATALSHYTIANTPRSALRVLGVADPRTPSWDRPAQILLGLALGALAVRRGRPEAVLLLAVAARIVLDPGTNRYYTAGMAVGALLWDVVGSRRQWPWMSTVVLLVLTVPRYWHVDGHLYGVATLLVCAGTLWTLCEPRPTQQPQMRPHAGEPALTRSDEDPARAERWSQLPID